MTLAILNQIVMENNIPNDAKMMSDSGWECDATDMDGIYYNSATNTLVFTQSGSQYDFYHSHPEEWKKLYSKKRN